MVFSSLIFLFLFLPVFLAVYYAVPFRGKSWVILIGSAIFYAWWRVDFLFLLLGVKFFNYYIARCIAKTTVDLHAKRWLILGIVGNLIVLAIFKYFNFGIDSLNAVLDASGIKTIEALRFILPIGISFAIFQCISFLIDIYRKDTEPAKSFIDFAAFVLLFPQLIAGPVLRYKDLAYQFTSRTHTMDKFSHGSYRFMCGFIKKVIIADTVAIVADQAFALEDPSMADAWLGAIAYSIQLYFDFSGYSDMAIGLGLMMGFKFMENFNSPYIAQSITEFWRRWHISLSTWLRDYLYIPLGGNRKGRTRTYINLILTMLLGGLWHGANWTFIVWGAWHGGIMAIERAMGVQGDVPSTRAIPVRIMLTAFTLILVILGWVMFRAENIGQALTIYTAMFAGETGGFSAPMDWQVTGVALSAMVIGIIVVFGVPLAERFWGFSIKETRSLWLQLPVILLFLLAIMKLGAQSYSPFLYFQF